MPRLFYLNRHDVESVAHKLAAKLFTNYEDPLPPFQLFGGLREGGALLESALALPRQPYYRTLFDKAGVLLRSLIKNHPLVDGNKRIGMTAAFVFLVLNNHVLVASNQEMVRFALEVAASEPDMAWEEVAAWVRARSVRITTSEETAELLVQKFAGDWDENSLGRRLDEYARIFHQLGSELKTSP